MIHFILPGRGETWVEDSSVRIGEVLWRLGYRSKKPRAKSHTAPSKVTEDLSVKPQNDKEAHP